MYLCTCAHILVCVHVRVRACVFPDAFEIFILIFGFQQFFLIMHSFLYMRSCLLFVAHLECYLLMFFAVLSKFC